MKKSFLTFFTLLFLFSFSINIPCFANKSPSIVKATIPNFKILINGFEIDNKNSKHPFIVYKNMEYIPLTFNYCNALGVNASWGNKDGLSISKDTSKTDTRVVQDSSFKNDINKVYTAKCATYNISLNGKKIDNSQREFPILTFRNITYFPNAYNFIEKDFGGRCSFVDKYGLSIHSHAYKPKFENLIKEFYTEGQIKTELFDKIKTNNYPIKTFNAVCTSSWRSGVSLIDINTNEKYSFDICDYNISDFNVLDFRNSFAAFELAEITGYVNDYNHLYPTHLKIYQN